ncbi:MAG: methyltransferase domain-containing protein [Clostridia bacterium]|nr:methyltransferase domain-containing protein [Clostridia bacterium]
MKKSHIDSGKDFDFGKTSEDYAKYRDIYPQEFYDKILQRGLCVEGQSILDIGTGTGVLPRNLYRFGGKFVGIDISENQIEQAKILAKRENMDIHFRCVSAEDADFDNETFDVVTACQCFTYFNHKILSKRLADMIKSHGKFVVLYMAWLPYEDELALRSENLILKYNPVWSGCGEVRHNIEIPLDYEEYFEIEYKDVFDLDVPFSRESWHGRMRACRGVGASLSDEDIAKWEKEHIAMLNENAPQNFNVKHYGAICVLCKKY